MAEKDGGNGGVERSTTTLIDSDVEEIPACCHSAASTTLSQGDTPSCCNGIVDMLAKLSSGQEQLRDEQHAQGKVLASILDALTSGNPSSAVQPRALVTLAGPGIHDVTDLNERLPSTHTKEYSSKTNTFVTKPAMMPEHWQIPLQPMSATHSHHSVAPRVSGIEGMVRELTMSRLSTTALIEIPSIPSRKDVWTYARDTITGERLDFVIGAVIFANCICIGAEIQENLEGGQNVGFQVLEHVFLCIYILEASAKIYSQGIQEYLANRWQLFDFFLVCSGVLGMWVIRPITIAQGTENQDTMHGNVLENVMILRVLRLLRLFRLVRFMSLFQNLWKLVNGLMQSSGAICSTFFLLIISVYVFACIGVELITQNETLLNDAELKVIVDNHFSSLYVTMVTLCRFVALDSTAQIYEPLAFKVPSLLMYFCAIAMVVSIALMNLVTAILVDAAINQSNEDKDVSRSRLRKRVKKLLPMLEDMFDELDIDNDERISAGDVHDSDKVPHDLKEALSEMSMIEIFETIDSQESGWLGKKEFVEGVLNIVLSDSPNYVTKVLHQMEVIHHTVQHLSSLLQGSSGLRQVCTTAKVGQDAKPSPGIGVADRPSSLPCSVES